MQDFSRLCHAALDRAPPLPIKPMLKAIAGGLVERGLAIVRAEPGAGKSTLVPLGLAAFAPRAGRILMLQPRRVAAVSLAWRIAELLGQEPGGTVGYRVSLDSRVGAHCQIEIITEGILTRLLQDDPSLEGVSVVIFDEFHERTVHSDLALALCLDSLSNLRPDLSLVLMSATMDTQAAAGLLANYGLEQGEGSLTARPVPIFDGAGTVFPVLVRHEAPPASISWWKNRRAFCEWVAQVIERAWLESTGDFLVFLPGRREIEDVYHNLNLPKGESVLMLHGSVPLAEQRQILYPLEQGRRIILATSIAETSVTIPGISTVIDSGLNRENQYDPGLGMDRLVTLRISQFGANQRTGRAGRLAKGSCIRLWSAMEVLAEASKPEIERVDLADFVLEAAVWGVRRVADLALVSPLGPLLWQAACATLKELGFLAAGSWEDDLLVSGAGRKASALGVDVRVAALLLAAGEGRISNAGPTAVILAAFFSEGMADLNSEGDLGEQIKAVLKQEKPRSRFWVQAQRLAERLGLDLDHAALQAGYRPELVPALFCVSHADFVAQLIHSDQQGAVYRLVSGREALVSARLLGGQHGGQSAPDFVVAVRSAAGKERSTIHNYVALDDGSMALFRQSAKEAWQVEWKDWTPKARLILGHGAIVFAEKNLPRNAPNLTEELKRAFLIQLRSRGLRTLPWDDASWNLLYRLRYGITQNPEIGPFPSDQYLMDNAMQCFVPYLNLTSAGAVIDSAVLARALGDLIAWDKRAILEREAPESLTLPNGRKRALVYGPLGSEQAILELRIQEAFGYRTHPMAGRRPVLLHLLSPARRPLQISSDLPGFWAGSYQEVRKEMRGRYPKHAWPENPHQVVLGE